MLKKFLSWLGFGSVSEPTSSVPPCVGCDTVCSYCGELPAPAPVQSLHEELSNIDVEMEQVAPSAVAIEYKSEEPRVEEQKVFAVDVGDMSKEKAQEYLEVVMAETLNEVKTEVKQKKAPKKTPAKKAPTAKAPAKKVDAKKAPTKKTPAKKQSKKK